MLENIFVLLFKVINFLKNIYKIDILLIFVLVFTYHHVDSS